MPISLMSLLLASSGPAPAAIATAAPMTAEAAMAEYDKVMQVHAGRPADCLSRPDEILVCRRAVHPSPRLPLPDERPARVAPPDRRFDSAAAFEQRLGCRMGCNPIESAEKGKRLVEIITGNDPDTP